MSRMLRSQALFKDDRQNSGWCINNYNLQVVCRDKFQCHLFCSMIKQSLHKQYFSVNDDDFIFRQKIR